MLEGINWFDAVVIALIVLFGLRGLANGIIKEIFGILGLIGGLMELLVMVYIVIGISVC